MSYLLPTRFTIHDIIVTIIKSSFYEQNKCQNVFSLFFFVILFWLYFTFLFLTHFLTIVWKQTAKLCLLIKLTAFCLVMWFLLVSWVILNKILFQTSQQMIEKPTNSSTTYIRLICYKLKSLKHPALLQCPVQFSHT